MIWKISKYLMVAVVAVIGATMALTVYSLYERHQASKKGEYLFVDRSSFLHDGRMITLKRYSMHAFFAEYKRVLVVDQRDGAQVTSELMSDSGGSSDIEICRSAAGELVMQDRLTAHLINVDGTVRERKHTERDRYEFDFSRQRAKVRGKSGALWAYEK